MEKKEYIAYFDGSCSVNPNGEMGAGAFVRLHNNEEELFTYSVMYGAKKGNTNNVAEYLGLIALLDWFIEQGLTNESIIIRGDSDMVVQQMNDSWRIKNGAYKIKALEAKQKVSLFTNLRIYWVPREGNKRADYLSNPSQKKLF